MTSASPVLVRMHPADNVAIVGNEGGLPAGTLLPEPATGLALRERVPQAHKVALVDIPEGCAVIRYGVTIGHALRDLARWHLGARAGAAHAAGARAGRAADGA